MKSLQVLVLAAMTYMTSFAVAFAQTAAPPPAAATPAPATGGVYGWGWNWFWVVVAIIVIAGLIWYFTSRRATDRRL